uniref:Acid-sensing ion channel 3 n=1 Tax=Trichoplax adhaerens TaxID=10228 RepID=A0A5J6BTF2_TRIAD|nr:acid-sensing ion channel 3 [Trichoplax adhaerens]
MDRNFQQRPRKPSVDFSTITTITTSTKDQSQDGDFFSQRQSSLNISYQHEEDFAKRTSCHGISHVFDDETPKLRRLSWVFLTLAMATICIIQCADRMIYLISNPTKIVIKNEIPPRIRFPAVTICNFNRFRNSTINESNYYRLQYLLRLMNAPQAPSKRSEFSFRNDLVNYSRNTNDDLDLLSKVGIQRQILIRYCNWDNQPHSCSAENFTLTYTKYGNCFLFNGQSADNEALYQKRIGRSHGLRLAFNVEADQYTTMNPEPDVGIKFRIHEPDEPADIEAQGVAIPPGYHAYVRLKYNEAKFLRKPIGKCDSRPLQYYDRYTRSGCKLECKTNKSIEVCGCRALYMPGSAPFCTAHQINQCMTNNIEEINNSSCYCPTACLWTSYDPAVSYSMTPTETITSEEAPLFGLNLDEVDANRVLNSSISRYMRKNYIFLDIFFERLRYNTAIQELGYTFNAFLSDIGGQLGLFIGASVLTMLEIGEYFLTKLKNLCKIIKRPTSQNEYEIAPASPNTTFEENPIPV